MAQSWEVVVMDSGPAVSPRRKPHLMPEGSAFVLAPWPACGHSIEQVSRLGGACCKQAQPAYAVGADDGGSAPQHRNAKSKARELLERLGITVLSTPNQPALSAWPKPKAAGVICQDARADSGRPESWRQPGLKQVGGASGAEIERGLT